MFLFVNLFSFTAEAHPNPNPNSNPNPTLYMIRDQTISVFVLSCGMPALCTSSACNPAPWPDQMWAAATEYSSDVLREC